MKRILTILPLTLNLTAADGARVASGAEMLGETSPSVKITFTRQSVVGVEPKVFLYKIEAIDGRVWKQTITFDHMTNPLMTFDLSDPWRLSEFSQQRGVRDAFVAFVGAYPDLEKITYDFE